MGKKKPLGFSQRLVGEKGFYFFFFRGFLAALFVSLIAACAAARRATGTRKGEQLT